MLPIPCYTYEEQRKTEQKVDVGPSDAALLLMMFSCCLSHTLVVTDDVDLYEADEPIPKLHLRRYINLTRKLLFRALWLDEILPSMFSTRSQSEYYLDSNYFGLSVISAATRALRDLYDRSSRWPICECYSRYIWFFSTMHFYPEINSCSDMYSVPTGFMMNR